jgi:hypothetical protein
MPLANVTALSDDDDTPKIDNQQGPGEELAKPKAKAKVKAEAKTKSTAKATSAKSTAKAKAKAKSAAKKRPAAAQDPEDGQAGISSAGGGMKRPAAAAELKVNKYIYHRDGVWGIKVDGREIIRVLYLTMEL